MTINKKTEYETPEVSVVELSVEGVFCQSLTDYTLEDELLW